MRTLFLAALLTSPSGAANIKTVPGELVVPLNTAPPRETIVAPVLPAGLTDPALRLEIPRLAAPAAALGPRLEREAVRLPVTAAADPAGRRGALSQTAPRLETEERRDAESGEKTEGAKETAEEL